MTEHAHHAPATLHDEGAAAGGKLDSLFPWVVALGILLADQITKQVALARLEAGNIVPVIGEYLSFTYVRNPGIAFGLHLGEWSRPFFVVTALVVLFGLISFYRSMPRQDRLRRLAVAILCAGAIGNLIDRIRWEEGVVDFIRLAVSGYEWPIFNVADMAVTSGAILLAISLLTEGRPRRAF
ncbi:MAG TPA: signal peptidase II [Longimicrobiales bacterium]